MNNTINKIVEELKKYSTFLITSHESGDGDSIGSQLALAFMLQKMQKEAIILNKDPVPEMYDFLPGVEKIQNETTRNLADFQVVLILDCGSLDRLGLTIPNQNLFINIDHHLDNDNFGYLNWVMPEMSSTAEMIYLLCKSISLPIDSAIGNNIFTGILTDTGSFRFSNTTSQCLHIAGELVEGGVKPSFIVNKVYERKNYAQLLLLGEALSDLKITEDGKIAYIYLKNEIFQKLEVDISDTEGFVNYPLSIASVKVVLFFKEISKNYFKISFRSKGQINVAAIAEMFNGGGHHNAAGAKVKGNFLPIFDKITEVITKQQLY